MIYKLYNRETKLYCNDISTATSDNIIRDNMGYRYPIGIYDAIGYTFESLDSLKEYLQRVYIVDLRTTNKLVVKVNNLRNLGYTHHNMIPIELEVRQYHNSKKVREFSARAMYPKWM